ncbi:pre-peptidase C-terminal domain-containing protein, partial [bacterium]|nr:pre-peptidase C-terminal domain-containing protein [bacterium]
ESVRHMDLVLFKSCNSLNLEAAYELRNAVDHIVGHESSGYANKRWDIAEIFDYIYSNPSQTAEEIANEIVSIYYEDNKDPWPWESHMENVVVATVRTANIARLAESMDTFVQTVLSDATTSDWAWFDESRDLARSWGNMVDIGSFMQWVIEGPPEVTASIRSAAEAVQVKREQVCHHYAWLGKSKATGLSTYYPDPATPVLNNIYNYRYLEYVKDWGWYEMFLVDDDSHEQDDAHWLANEQDVLDPGVFFDGRSWDNDVFRIHVPEGQEHVQVVCNFSHSEGDINLHLFSSNMVEIASAESTNSNESLHFTVPKHGLYFLRVTADEQDAGGQDYALRWLHSAPASAPGTPPRADEPSEKMTVELVVLLNESGIDTSPTLPVGVPEIYTYSPFVVEVWARNADGSPNGITGGYVGIGYDDMVITPDAVHAGGIYTGFPAAEMRPGAITDMGGQAPLGALGYGDDEWVRLGWVDFTAGSYDEFISVDAFQGYDSFARANEGAIDEFEVAFTEFVEFNVVEGPPMVRVDLQADSDSGASDNDNITNVNTPTFEVTVNYEGTVRIDYEGDAEWDEVRLVEEPGTYEFTPFGPLPDGEHPVLVDFDVPGLGTDCDSDPTTVGTAPPEATLAHPFNGESLPATAINVHDRYIDVTFVDRNGSGMDPVTILDVAREFTLSGAAATGVTVNSTPLRLFGNTYRYFFAGDFLAGPVGVDFTPGSFEDLAGNTNAAGVEGFTIVAGGAGVVERHVFYNNSAWDGNDPAAGPSDDGAIALDKAVLLPGQTATFANYTSYSRGINGVMVDIDGLIVIPTADDFGIRVNEAADPDLWSEGPPPIVSFRPGEGLDDSDRGTLIWSGGAIIIRWVVVTTKATPNT